MLHVLFYVLGGLVAFLGSFIATVYLTLRKDGAEWITLTDEQWEKLPRHPRFKWIRYL